ncbi:MAG: flagellar motor protein MotB [Pseudomonadota bacterium]
MAAKSEERPIIIKRVKKVAGGHHGGAWKVAYADFVTAMMAFFMLLWLLNVSDAETLQGLADYFTPSNASMSNSSGAGDILAGTAFDKDGASAAASANLTVPTATTQKVNTEGEDAGGPTQNNESEVVVDDRAWQANVVTREDKMFAAVEDSLKAAIQKTPELLQYKDQLIIEQTPEGLRIQLVDKDRRSMFKRGSAELYPFAIRLLETVGQVVQSLPNRISVTGHTDATPSAANADYSNWELSADRANAARRVLSRGGVSRDRFSQVTGKAATEPLFPDNPLRAENKRVSILILREAPVVDPNFGRKAE